VYCSAPVDSVAVDENLKSRKLSTKYATRNKEHDRKAGYSGVTEKAHRQNIDPKPRRLRQPCLQTL
jgi:hypothetical protein